MTEPTTRAGVEIWRQLCVIDPVDERAKPRILVEREADRRLAIAVEDGDTIRRETPPVSLATIQKVAIAMIAGDERALRRPTAPVELAIGVLTLLAALQKAGAVEVVEPEGAAAAAAAG